MGDAALRARLAHADAGHRGEGAALTTVPRIDYPKLLSLGALHMGQYFPAAFTGVALPALFRQAGLPLEMFWLLALPGIPRWLKWLIALVVDNYGSVRIGVRKSWIIPCTLLGTLLYFSLSFLERRSPSARNAGARHQAAVSDDRGAVDVSRIFARQKHRERRDVARAADAPQRRRPFHPRALLRP